jgi:hypothetical protein
MWEVVLLAIVIMVLFVVSFFIFYYEESGEDSAGKLKYLWQPSPGVRLQNKINPPCGRNSDLHVRPAGGCAWVGSMKGVPPESPESD